MKLFSAALFICLIPGSLLSMETCTKFTEGLCSCGLCTQERDRHITDLSSKTGKLYDPFAIDDDSDDEAFFKSPTPPFFDLEKETKEKAASQQKIKESILGQSWRKSPDPDHDYQDRIIWDIDHENQAACFIIADGHGQEGEKISEIAVQKGKDLLKPIQKLYKSGEAHKIPEFIENEITALQNSLKTNPSAWSSGTTLAAIYIIEKQMYLVNIGDSRIGLTFTDGNFARATTDHKPNDPVEIARIRSIPGGAIEQNPQERSGNQLIIHPPRVYFYRDKKNKIGGYSVSRVLGDTIMTQTGAMTHTPDITPLEWKDKDGASIYGYAFLCSDGVTDVLSNEEITEIIRNAPDVNTAAKNIVDAAYEKGSGDDITVQVVNFDLLANAFAEVQKKESGKKTNPSTKSPSSSSSPSSSPSLRSSSCPSSASSSSCTNSGQTIQPSINSQTVSILTSLLSQIAVSP